MSGTYVVAVQGIAQAAGSVKDIPAEIRTAAKLAVNATARRTRTSAAKQILAQVNFGASYLNENDRFTISQFATQNDLTAKITGRQRPTSLARFASGQLGGRDGVTVEVAPGNTRRSKRMFLIKLRSGNANIETKFNMGLAIRLRKGERIQDKKKMVQLGHNLYLLYGPSIDQVFAQVADASAPEASQFLEQEFNRLLEI